jgi:hypothetical protein
VRHAVYAAAVGLMLASPLAAQGRDRINITGQVVDAKTGAPIPGVELQVASSRSSTALVTSGKDGRFRMALRPGSHGVIMSRLGYETAIARVEVGSQPGNVGVFQMNPDAVTLEALRVSVDRVERMRNAAAFPSYSFGLDELSRYAGMDAGLFVSSRTGLFPVFCNQSASGMRDCVLYRGRLTRVCVVMDDNPVMAGLSGLTGYQMRDFARIIVYHHGAFVQVYTPEYLVRIAQRDYRPMSVSLQMTSYCQFNPGGSLDARFARS